MASWVTPRCAYNDIFHRHYLCEKIVHGLGKHWSSKAGQDIALQDTIREITFSLLWYHSQGASVSMAICAHQQLCQAGEGIPAGLGWQPLRFAILCSGYISPAPEQQQLHAATGNISLPSLHVFGTKSDAASSCGGISAAESRALAGCFDPCQRLVVEHSGGHYIPVSKPVLSHMRQFLRQFI